MKHGAVHGRIPPGWGLDTEVFLECYGGTWDNFGTLIPNFSQQSTIDNHIFMLLLRGKTFACCCHILAFIGWLGLIIRLSQVRVLVGPPLHSSPLVAARLNGLAPALH